MKDSDVIYERLNILCEVTVTYFTSEFNLNAFDNIAIIFLTLN